MDGWIKKKKNLNTRALLSLIPAIRTVIKDNGTTRCGLLSLKGDKIQESKKYDNVVIFQTFISRDRSFLIVEVLKKKVCFKISLVQLKICVFEREDVRYFYSLQNIIRVFANESLTKGKKFPIRAANDRGFSPLIRSRFERIMACVHFCAR